MAGLPQEFGPYVLERLIGRGGMGEVFEAYDKAQDRLVAVKRLVPYLADDVEFQRRFGRESRIAARLRNPHIIPIHRYGQIDGHLYIEMRLVDGPNLEDVIEVGGPLDVERAVSIVEQLASALDAAHRDGLVHRDIKPSNILLDRTGETDPDFVYLADFGITRPMAGRQSQGMTTSHAIVGSLDYMAPEQFDGTMSRAVDIYALGCVLYQCLVGHRPFEVDGLPALMHAHLTLAPPMPTRSRPELPSGLDRVVHRALQKHPQDRYSTAGELSADARRALKGEPVAGSTGRPGQVPGEHPDTDSQPPVPEHEENTPELTETVPVSAGAADSVLARGSGSQNGDARAGVAPVAVGRAAPTNRVRQGEIDDAAGNGAYGSVATVEDPGVVTRPPDGPADASGDVQAPPPPGAPPGPGHGSRGDDGTPRPPRRRRLTVGALVAASLALVVLVGLGGWAVVRTVAPAPSRSVPAPLPAPLPTNASTTAQAAPSVPVPALGPAVQAGPSPSFAAVSPTGRLLYVANGAARTVTVVDTSVNQPVATIPVPVGPPQYLAFSPDGSRVYVSVFDEARTIAAVAVLDTTTDDVVATIPVRTRPFLGAVSPDGRQLWVPNHDSGTISIIDTASNAVEREIKVAPNPHWVAFSHDGSKAYTANHESNLVSVLDTRTDAIIGQIPVAMSPHSVAVHPTRPLLANVDYDANVLTLIDTNSNTVIGTVPVGANPQDVAWAPDGRFAYVVNATGNSLSVVDLQAMRVTATLPTPPGPTSIAVTPDGRTGYISCSDGNVVATVLLTG